MKYELFSKSLIKVIQNTFNQIITTQCVLCQNAVEKSNLLCHECWKEIEFIHKKHNELYVQSVPTVCTAIRYNKIAKKLIHQFKYKSPSLFCEIFAKWLYLLFREELLNCDAIIPVPIHKNKLKRREYNQTAILAKRLSTLTGKKCYLDCIVKTHDTVSQSILSQEKRIINVTNTFAINSKFKNSTSLENKNIIILDDVITTGATIAECYRVLRNVKGIKNITCMSIART